MNESDYMKAVWGRVGKIKEGNKYVDMGLFDNVFAGNDFRREIALNRMGQENAYRNAMLDQRQKNLDWRGKDLGRRANLAEDIQDSRSRDALTADILTGLSIPLGYIEGKREADFLREQTKGINDQNMRLRSILGKY